MTVGIIEIRKAQQHEDLRLQPVLHRGHRGFAKHQIDGEARNAQKQDQHEARRQKYAGIKRTWHGGMAPAA